MYVIGLAVLLLLLQAAVVFGDEGDHKYKDSEPVTLWVNKVGPYNNPQVCSLSSNWSGCTVCQRQSAAQLDPL
jgi:hypothetical protein